MNEYRSKMRLVLYVVENFIDFDDIKPIEETLQQIQRASIVTKIDFKNPSYYSCTLEETRVELQDNPLDPIGFAEAAKINYFNMDICE